MREKRLRQRVTKDKENNEGKEDEDREWQR